MKQRIFNTSEELGGLSFGSALSCLLYGVFFGETGYYKVAIMFLKAGAGLMAIAFATIFISEATRPKAVTPPRPARYRAYRQNITNGMMLWLCMLTFACCTSQAQDRARVCSSKRGHAPMQLAAWMGHYSDTLHIDPTQVNYIEIGGRVYVVALASLEEMEPTIRLLHFKPQELTIKLKLDSAGRWCIGNPYSLPFK